jgi:small subunit ribosomal protein S17
MSKQFTGIVTSDKTDKTIVVTISVKKTHPIYRKQFTKTNKIMAHDENNEAKIGDKVTISETRPISSRKSFKLDKIVERPVLQMTSDDKGEVK